MGVIMSARVMAVIGIVLGASSALAAHRADGRARVRPLARTRSYSARRPRSSVVAAAQPSLSYTPSESERAASDVIDVLFGRENSKRAFNRQRMSMNEIETSHHDEIDNRLTYGEFDLNFFFSLVRAAEPKPGEVFCDLGSGCGRLVLAAALADYEWSCAVGVELLEDLDRLARGAHETLVPLAAGADDLTLSPCEFVHGDAEEELLRLAKGGLGGGAVEPDTPWVLFSYTTCMPSVGPYLCQLSAILGRALPLGSRVITTDKQLVSDEEGARWTFRELYVDEAPNYNTMTSHGYVYELVAKDLAKIEAADRGDAAGTVSGGGGAVPANPGRMLTRRAMAGIAGIGAPLLLARRVGAAEPAVADAPAQPSAPAAAAGRDGVRSVEVAFKEKALGFALADKPDDAGAPCVTVTRVEPGTEADASPVPVGARLRALGGRELPAGTRAADVRRLLADAPRPVTLRFEVAERSAVVLERAAKTVGVETERFKIDRLTEPPASCATRSRRGDTVEIHYEARIADSGRVFDSSYERGIGGPFALQLGNGDVPKALELGIFEMCVGEARRIVAPPRLAYGVGGNRALGVPANATIQWDVSMESINFQTDPAVRREDTGMAFVPWSPTEPLGE